MQIDKCYIESLYLETIEDLVESNQVLLKSIVYESVSNLETGIPQIKDIFVETIVDQPTNTSC